MTQSTEDINEYFKGKNFITPEVIDYYQSDDYICELSSGPGIFNDKKVYGVTVVAIDGKPNELSDMFYSLKEAKAYINSL